MTVRPALQCHSMMGWFPVEVQSESDKDTRYVVHVNPWLDRWERHICDCKGFQYRGYCKHQRQAHEQICGWNEVTGEQPSEEQRRDKVCPRCLGPAVWSMYDDQT